MSLNRGRARMRTSKWVAVLSAGLLSLGVTLGCGGEEKKAAPTDAAKKAPDAPAPDGGPTKADEAAAAGEKKADEAKKEAEKKAE